MKRGGGGGERGEMRLTWSTCGSILASGCKIAGTEGECGVGVEMKWVRLIVYLRAIPLSSLGPCLNSQSLRGV